MISVNDALTHILAELPRLNAEKVNLYGAMGRVLAVNVSAKVSHPPFNSSSMDGYLIADQTPMIDKPYILIGEAAAGKPFKKAIRKNETIRIFTGAPVAAGGCSVVIQEDITKKGKEIWVQPTYDKKNYIRPIGNDFSINSMLNAPVLITPYHISLLAAMNLNEVCVSRKPRVAIITTGDELVMPGETPSESQIISSNAFGLYSMVKNQGADPIILPIARDNEESLISVLKLATDCDLILTIGGASVGDYDIVQKCLKVMGLRLSFYKVAMKPGKPLFAGKLGTSSVIGLPGNPISSLICGELFVIPAIKRMLGLTDVIRKTVNIKISHNLEINGPRETYMRASVDSSLENVKAFLRQDSSLITILTDSNALIKRPANAHPVNKGSQVPVLLLS
ncbi:MAG: molybdopterin molybdotransferase MoeA [Proteobacteria bacterium]|nr:molybdopterin molybdotransferase MoeA [Pseudomonadota bacterium]